MQPASGQQAAPDLAKVKLRSEILKLKTERSLLRRQLRRGNRPTWWEVVKTVVPWLSLAVGALAFATGYLQSLRQERQEILQVAMGHYLGSHPEVGAYLLRELAKDGEKKGPLKFLSPAPPDVPAYLIQGIDVESTDPKTAVLNHRRNVAALQVLAVVRPPIGVLCETCSKAGKTLDQQLISEPLEGTTEKEQQDATSRSVDFLCKCGDLLEELDASQNSCRREAWDDVKESAPLYVSEWEGHCLRRASPVGNGPFVPSTSGGGRS